MKIVIAILSALAAALASTDELQMQLSAAVIAMVVIFLVVTEA